MRRSSSQFHRPTEQILLGYFWGFSASASRWLRQHSASASRWLRSLAPCMHSATLRQRFALAPRSSSPQSALRAACCDPRCLHTGPLNPRCVAALRAAAVTVTACGSSRSAIDRGTLEACRWNLEFKVILNFRQTGLFIQNRSKFIQNRSKSLLLL